MLRADAEADGAAHRAAQLVLIAVSIASPLLVDDHVPISLSIGRVSTVRKALPSAPFIAALLPAVTYLLVLPADNRHHARDSSHPLALLGII